MQKLLKFNKIIFFTKTNSICLLVKLISIFKTLIIFNTKT